MDIRQHTVLRDWIALILILVVVPLSVFGGTNITCDSQGLSQTCAPQPAFSSPMVLISPLILMAAGVVAGLITSGWTGLFVVGVGQIAGQVVIVAMSYVAGRPVPIDLFSGIDRDALVRRPDRHRLRPRPHWGRDPAGGRGPKAPRRTARARRRPDPGDRRPADAGPAPRDLAPPSRCGAAAPRPACPRSAREPTIVRIVTMPGWSATTAPMTAASAPSGTRAHRGHHGVRATRPARSPRACPRWRRGAGRGPASRRRRAPAPGSGCAGSSRTMPTPDVAAISLSADDEAAARRVAQHVDVRLDGQRSPRRAR